MNSHEKLYGERNLTPNDLGIKGTVKQFKVLMTVEKNEVYIYVEMIEAKINNIFEVIGNLKRLARKENAKKLYVVGVLANQKLFDVLASRYDLDSKKGLDYIEFNL